MVGAFSFISMGTILLVASLQLERESSGKDSIAYKQLKNWGLTGASMAWVGYLILGLLM